MAKASLRPSRRAVNCLARIHARRSAAEVPECRARRATLSCCMVETRASTGARSTCEERRGKVGGGDGTEGSEEKTEGTVDIDGGMEDGGAGMGGR